MSSDVFVFLMISNQLRPSHVCCCCWLRYLSDDTFEVGHFFFLPIPPLYIQSLQVRIVSSFALPFWLFYNMAFEVAFQNSLVELHARKQRIATVSVLSVLGNKATFGSSVARWQDSPAWSADMVLTVLRPDVDQARYVRLDGDGESYKDWTGTDEAHSAAICEGVVAAMRHATVSRRWIVAGASGGCATAVCLCRELLRHGDEILGLVADCGVPGNGAALAACVPVSVFQYRVYWEYWNGGQTAQIWSTMGYNVHFEHRTSEGRHAGLVNRRALCACIQWYLKQKKVPIHSASEPDLFNDDHKDDN